MKKETEQITPLAKENFPQRLLQITDPPKKLYIRGVLPPEDYKYLCVVGARKYSEYGRQAVEKLISGLRGYPVVVVSGLALGIDSIAHRAALEAGLKTLAVPGSGLDPKVLYPASHKQLAEKIVAAGGCLLSEFEPMFRPTAYSFPQRNRIMAGLSDAVLVVEAELKSGTLITSKFATEYNRDVLTIPGSIFSPTTAGPHMLLRIGATPISSSVELLDALGFDGTLGLESKKVNYDNCSAEELRVVNLLKTPTPRDELIQNLGLSASEANVLLGMMEIKGLVKESLGEIRLT
ncbi:MAG: protecting protein DprA protein [Parcubacteria group bacterium GW2011_GWA2_47_16]|nr:MAG: protecting protein DprA protein [Parcubacteria group bacterium GW2011_GWA2_47_16]